MPKQTEDSNKIKPEQDSAYIPGVCNLNTAETTRRKKAGYFGLIFFIVILVALLYLAVNRFIRLVLFVPAFIAAIGFLQAKNKFCVSYAASGLENSKDGSLTANKITDLNSNKTDKLRARVINTQAFAIAIAITLLSLIIPSK
jgi:hypothetical protein